MAYAQHIALNLPMEIMKSDMYYFRAKIVSDLYIDQYVRWKQKKQDDPLPDQFVV